MNQSTIRQRRRRIFYVAASVFAVVFLSLILILLHQIRKTYGKTASDAAGQEAYQDPEDPGISQLSTEDSSDNTALTGMTASNTDSSATVSESSTGSSPADDAPEGFIHRTMQEKEMHQGILQLINKVTEYTFQDDWLVLMDDQDRYGYGLNEYDIQMARPAAEAINDFLNNFYEETLSYDVYILDGYRSKEASDALFQADVAANGYDYAIMYTMQGGYSEHHSGLAADLGLFSDVYFHADNDERNQWIYDHAADYGFILRYPEGKEAITQIAYESWHFRYVGVPSACAMKSLGICLEEWIEFIKNYTPEAPFEVSTPEGIYEIYYQEGLEVLVPENTDYTLSGNNVDGFIITFPKEP